MKFGIFLILLSCCFYLATARPNDSDIESEVNSEDVSAEKSDNEEFDDETSGSDFGSDGDSDDDWGKEDTPEENPAYEGLNAEEIKLMEKLRLNRMRDHAQGKVASLQATDRLQKEWLKFRRSESFKNGDVEVELIDESLYDWRVSVKRFDPTSPLFKDLQELNRTEGIDRIVMHFKFKETYPFEAPFVRIVSPVLTGKHLLHGGGICMELLVPVGWIPAYSIEAITWQIISFMIVGDGRIPKQNKNYANMRYSYAAAVKGFHMIPGWFERILNRKNKAPNAKLK